MAFALTDHPLTALHGGTAQRGPGIRPTSQRRGQGPRPSVAHARLLETVADSAAISSSTGVAQSAGSAR